jgi:hypothetical protein
MWLFIVLPGFLVTCRGKKLKEEREDLLILKEKKVGLQIDLG